MNQIDGFSEYYYLKDYFEYLGFPKITENDYLKCGVNNLSDGCTREGIYIFLPPSERLFESLLLV